MRVPLSLRNGKTFLVTFRKFNAKDVMKLANVQILCVPSKFCVCVL